MTREFIGGVTWGRLRALAVALLCVAAVGCGEVPPPTDDAGEEAVDDVPEKDYGPLPIDVPVDRAPRRDAPREAPPLDDVPDDLPEEDDLPTTFDAAPDRVPADAARSDVAMPPPDSLRPGCAELPVLRGSTTITGDTSEPLPLAYGCYGGSPTPTPTRFYRVLVPAGHWLRVRTRGPVAIGLYASCESVSCLGALGAGEWRSLIYENGATEQTLVLAVLPRRTTSETYAVDVAIEPPSPGLSCATAPLLASGDSIELPTTRFTDAWDSCVVLDSFRAGFAAVDVPAGQQLVVWPNPHTVASIYASCSTRDCLGRSRLVYVDDFGHPVLSGAAVWTNDTSAAARVIVALRVYDGSPSVRTVGATVRVSPVEPTQRCQTAPPLPVGATVSAAVVTAGVFPGPCSSTRTAAPARWWRVVVPAGHRALAWVRPASTSYFRELLVAFAERCDARCCTNVAGISDGINGGGYAAWTNVAAEAREVYVTLFGDAPPVDLTVTTAPPAPNVTCASRAPLRPGADVTDRPFLDALDGTPVCDLSPRASSALHYGVVVPARTRLTLRTTSGEAPHTVAIRSACGSPTALAVGYSTTTPAASTTRWANPFTTPTEVFVDVRRSSGPGPYGAFNLSASLDTIPAHAFCATPLTLTPGVPRSDQSGDATDLATDCGAPRYPALFYQITVPAGQRVVARVVEGHTVLNILDHCDATTCLGTYDFATRSASWHNTSAASRTVLLAATNLSDRLSERYTVTASFETSAVGVRCDEAPYVDARATLTNQSLVGLVDVPLACGGTHTARFYWVSVPARLRLVVTATPRGSPPPAVALSVLTACGSGTCLAVSAGATVAWTNASGAVREVLVAAAPVVTSPPLGATVDLRFDVAPAP